MTQWIEAVPAFAVALLILAVPGAAVLAALRIRGLLALCLAPAISVSVLAVSAIVAPLIHLSWGIPVVLLGTAIAAGAAWVARRYIPALNSIEAVSGPRSRVGLTAGIIGALTALAITTLLLLLVAPTPSSSLRVTTPCSTSTPRPTPWRPATLPPLRFPASFCPPFSPRSTPVRGTAWSVCWLL
ncbi:hypothetical protein NHF46_23345 [Arthrobacter alpinus]|nr:hypothetical protein [Arthrobacter alpinus]